MFIIQRRKDNLYKRIGIYAIRDKESGAMYIGQTTMNFGDRRDCHFANLRNNKHWVKPLQDAWNESNGERIEFIPLHDLESGEDIDQLEIDYISKYRDKGFCVNYGDGGKIAPNTGKHLTVEAKRKIGEKNRINMTGRKASEETKRKMSKTHKKRLAEMPLDKKQTALAKQLETKSHMDLSWTEEQRKKFSDIQKQRPNGSQFDIEVIREIRRMHEVENKTITEIANELQMNRGTVYGIATYRRWANAV